MAQHRFGGTPPEVAAILTDPDFYARLALPDVAMAEILSTELGDDGARTVRLRYEFVGSLVPIALQLLGRRRLAWIQEIRVDAADRSGSVHFEVEIDPRRLHGAATFTLQPRGEATVRDLQGELVVGVPAIGRMAERRIVPGLLRRMDVEAAALDERLGD
ncbi:MAG: DUF2505 family protein [Acidimicrobiales bacterium]